MKPSPSSGDLYRPILVDDVSERLAVNELENYEELVRAKVNIINCRNVGMRHLCEEASLTSKALLILLWKVGKQRAKDLNSDVAIKHIVFTPSDLGEAT